MAEGTDAFLLQKVEFLECELQESKVREMNLKKLNDSLMSLVNKADRTPLKEEAIEELKRRNDEYQSELKELKRRSNAQQDALLSQISDLKKRCKDLEFALKECEVVKEREKLQLKEVIREVEADKAAFAASLARVEEDNADREERVKSELEMRVSKFQKQLEQQEDAFRQELERLNESHESRLSSQSSTFDSERRDLLQQISSLQSKLQTKSAKAKQYKEALQACERPDSPLDKTPKKYDHYLASESLQQLIQDNTQLRAALKRFERSTNLYQVQIRQLQGDLALRRSEDCEVMSLIQTLEGKDREIEKLNRKIATTSFQDRSFLSGREEKRMGVSPLSTTRASDWRNCTTRSGVMGGTMRKEENASLRESQLMDLKLSLEGMSLQKEKAQIELDRLLLEVKQNKLDWAISDSQRGENELELKREIKFLLGKLLKAKTRLTNREDASFRSKSALRMRTDQSQAYPDNPFAP